MLAEKNPLKEISCTIYDDGESTIKIKELPQNFGALVKRDAVVEMFTEIAEELYARGSPIQQLLASAVLTRLNE